MAVRQATRTTFIRMIRMETDDTNTASSWLQCSDPTSRRQNTMQNVFLVAGQDRCAELDSCEGQIRSTPFQSVASVFPFVRVASLTVIARRSRPLLYKRALIFPGWVPLRLCTC